MEKILIVCNEQISLKDISFFYRIDMVKTFSEAEEIILHNENVSLAILDDMEGLDGFISYLNSVNNGKIEFIVNSRSKDFERTRTLFKLGARDVVSFNYMDIDLFDIIDKTFTDAGIQIKSRRLQRMNRTLENEVVEYQILYETTKILRMNLDFKGITHKLIELVEGITSANAYFAFKKSSGYKYYTKGSSIETISYIRKFLKRHKLKKLTDIIDEFPMFYPFDFEEKMWYVLPIIIRNNVKGYLILLRDSNEEFSDLVIGMVNNILSQAGIVIENAMLLEETKNISFETVKALVKAIEAKDIYTKGHSQRVAELSKLIAKTMNFSEDRMKKLEMAAVLHDVGKIGLPEAILNKPGALTADEYEWIKMHPGKGAEIVSQIKNMKNIAEIIKHHHESWDGRGYPNAIAGNIIPIESRIISIADTYDAVTSDRPYRKGNSHEFAVKIITDGMGIQFDPHIAELFITFSREKIKKVMKYIDARNGTV